jgi:hypothetical protein
MDTTIRITQKTKDRLAKHGKYGDTMDVIINDVLDEVESH